MDKDRSTMGVLGVIVLSFVWSVWYIARFVYLVWQPGSTNKPGITWWISIVPAGAMLLVSGLILGHLAVDLWKVKRREKMKVNENE